MKNVYYAGSKEQWGQILIDEGNENLQSATIHYNFGGSEGSGTGSGSDDTGNSGAGSGSGGTVDSGSGSTAGTVQKKVQSIMADDIIKTYGTREFSLGAKSSGGTTLFYAVSNPKVAAVDSSGNVTVKGCGITDITITAAETSAYSMAQKTIQLTVKPKKMAIESVKSKKKKTATVKWKKDKRASGYLIECAADKRFKQNRVRTDIKKNKTTAATVKNLKSGKKYFVRICAYAKSGNTKIQGDWSKVKTVKVKK